MVMIEEMMLNTLEINIKASIIMTPFLGIPVEKRLICLTSCINTVSTGCTYGYVPRIAVLSFVFLMRPLWHKVGHCVNTIV